MHFYFLSIFVSLKKPQCGGRCSAEPEITNRKQFSLRIIRTRNFYDFDFYDKFHFEIDLLLNI